LFADIIVDLSVEALDRTFQYIIPKQWEGEVFAGCCVKIPFGRGNRLIRGYVMNITDQAAWPIERMKEISEIEKKELPVESKLIQLAAWIRQRYGTTMNEALKTVLPIRRQIKSVEEHWLNFALPEDEMKKELNRCLLKHYKAKARLLQGMFAEGGQMTSKLAAKKYKITKPVIDSMAKAGWITVTNQKKYRNPVFDGKASFEKKMLNEEQQTAVDAFIGDYRQGRRTTYLLYGVTGSGKTEVYMEMIQAVLQENKQVIMLIPEIALTYQTVVRFQKRFGDRVTVLNSRMSEGEKYDQYERAKQGEVDIVVGPRSALFIPFSNLGLILIDEEHEMSYKSEKPPKYHARDVAIERARQSGASVVLGSATPSVESYEKAKTGEYTLLTLPHRVNHVSMPKVYVADLRKELEEGNRSIFSRVLQEKIEERLKRGEQTILFLNRRGYAGFVSCRSCGFVLKCSHCEVSMTAHKNHVGDVDTLVCHYCGHAIAMPKTCPSCGSPYIAAFGLGTQKVEEMLNKRFPTARVLRMDGDTTTGKHGHESVLTPFRNGEADILIGTQMIVKGHDFPNVTLVAALAADMSLYAGDYRSSERTFELLMQASGRAGRAEKAGEVVIQTYNPEEYSIQAVAGQDAEYFYENELAFRRLMKYPPYSQMAAILILSEEENEAKTLSEKLAENIHSVCGDAVTLIGPSKAGLSRAKDRYRYVLYVKSMDEEAMACVREIAEEANRRVVNQKTCSVQYDRDPVNGY